MYQRVLMCEHASMCACLILGWVCIYMSEYESMPLWVSVSLCQTVCECVNIC